MDIETGSWGWTAILSGFGLLADEFTEQEIKIWELHKYEESEVRDVGGVYGWTWFNKEKGIKIPLRPFSGEIGVAPGEAGQYPTIPPYATGGNIDLKHLTKGSTVYLPVKVAGALFSIGVSLFSGSLSGSVMHGSVDRSILIMTLVPQDGHAAQGDGGELY